MPPSKNLSCFAISAPGLEQITATEMGNLGIKVDEVIKGGVSWSGDLESVYGANLWLRTASRVIVRVASFHAASFPELERKARSVPWAEYLKPGMSVRFKVTCRKSRLYHSDGVAQRMMGPVKAIVGDEVSVGVFKGSEDQDDIHNHQLFIIRLDHDQVTVSVDASGALLHRRGYRQAVAKAPLRETLAAAMLLSSGWDSSSPLIDPMCGSGTIPIEASLIARRIAPGRSRPFSFFHWPSFDAGVWHTLRNTARDQELERAPGLIRGSDRDMGAIRASLSNAERAEVAADIDFAQKAISDVEPAGEKGWIVTNPPYGSRIGDASVRNLYAQFGKVVRTVYPGWVVTMLSAEPSLDRQTGLKFSKVFATSNGGIPVRFIKAMVQNDRNI